LNRFGDRSGAFLLMATAGVVFAALLLLLALTATPARAETTRTLNGEYPINGARRLELGIPFGEIRVEGTDEARVRIRIKGTCEDDDCEKVLDNLRLESSNHGGTLKVHLEGTTLQKTWNAKGGNDDGDDDEGDDSHLEIVVQVPRSLQVNLNMGAGEVNVAGLRRDLSIDLGAGEVTVRMLERHVGKVDVNMAIGETTIHQGGRTREYTRVLGGPVRWREGKGDAGIDVNIGAGEVDVTLE
jgi:hypothetical protein